MHHDNLLTMVKKQKLICYGRTSRFLGTAKKILQRSERKRDLKITPRNEPVCVSATEDRERWKCIAAMSFCDTMATTYEM